MKTSNTLKTQTLGGMVWSFGERILAQVVNFVVSIILARLLLPEEYGVISLVTVIISILNVFITSGFATSLIQKKDADDTDFSSVFYFGLVFSAALYGLLFLAAPVISSFYEYEELTAVIRVMGLSLVISSVKSVQHSYISRRMEFRKFFWSTLGGTIVSAFVGIAMAYRNFGVWALVGQYLSNNLIDTAVMWFTVKWRPKKVFSVSRLKVLISFGWKVLAQNLLSTVYQDLRTLIIGKVYSSEDLAYYNKGKQFPDLPMNNINSAISSALLPAMSKHQDHPEMLKAMIARFIKTGSYLTMPLVIGIAMVGKPLVLVLLTDKWIECVPFLQLMCLANTLLPLQTANTQAVTACGRSDITLKAEIIKRGINIVIILITFRISVMAIAIGAVAGGLSSFAVNTVISKKLFDYGPVQQLRDLLPTVVLCCVMAAAVWAVSLIPVGVVLSLILQIVVGGAVYILASWLSRNESFRYVLDMLRPYLKRGRQE